MVGPLHSSAIAPPGWAAQAVPLAALAALTALAVVAWRLGATLPRGRRPAAETPFSLRRFLRGDERATAMFDFVLTFPIFLMIVLVVVQMALAINARLVVSWAAYAAARSAVVNTDNSLEAARGRAERAAALATLPISPSIRLFEYPDPAILPLLAAGNENPRLPGTQIQRRWRRSRGKLEWARRATEVEIDGADGTGRFAPKAPVTVTVTHRYRLAVPWAGDVFAAFAGERWLGGPVAPLRETVTLVNQGRIATDGELVDRCWDPGGDLFDWLRRTF